MLAAGCSNSSDSIEQIENGSVTVTETSSEESSSVKEKATTTTTSSEEEQDEETTSDDTSLTGEESSDADESSETAEDTSSEAAKTKQKSKATGSSITSTDTTKSGSTASTDTSSSSASASSSGTTSQSQTSKTTTSGSSQSVTASFTASTSGKIDTTDIFSNRDLKQTADLTDATYLTVSDGKTLSITEAGIYVISGTAKNCTIRIETDSESKVQLVLNGVSVTNTSTPAIYVINADKVFVTTASDTTNTLSVTGQFTADGDTNTDAVIFSKDDLVFNGLGTLNITSAYGNGISGKDDIKFTGGTYSITCALDAIEANDSIAVCGGSFTINSKKDGLHAENDEDYTEGWIYISDGTFNITATSDGIQGTTYTQIDGGNITIKSSEGIESTYIQINGGTINISATDDGLNASKKSTAIGTPTVEVTGGKLTVTMSGSDVDCIDANGNIIVSGGTIDLSYPTQGPSESFDYDGTATYTGGTIIINGSQVDSIPQASMMGGMGGFGGNMGGGFGGRGGRGWT
ncbi:MAG: carbohydrate-binding domain-containing protein [Ruminococcus sp.]|nr:carbohydrate-binding domain-containing protein [Ruminococcus sp.]